LLNSNINLWFAKNTNNDIVTINEIEVKNNKEKYYCPLCGSEVIPKATNSKLITAHFAHIDASKCTSESMIHWWFKHKFLELGDKFRVVSDKEREYVCKEILVEQSYTVGDRIYRPDVTIKTECGNVIYFEMKFSNEKKLKDYIDIWLELKNIVVEIDIKKLMSKDKLPVFNALFYDGKCFNVKKGDLYHETIGRHKENLFKNSDVSDKLKERIQKLDWFWEEIINYKKDKIDIESITDFIDYSESEDKNLIFEILSNKKCTPIYEDYVNYKVNLFEKLASELFNDNKYFSLEKIKLGRKYKNIKYNAILIKNTYLKEKQFEIYKYVKDEFTTLIKDMMIKINNLAPYYNIANRLCSLIENKNKYIDGLYLSISKNNIENSYLYSISLKEYWHDSCASIYIWKDRIEDMYNKYNNLVIDILDNNNESDIVRFITNAINKGIIRYKKKSISEKIRIQKIEREKQKHLIKEINKERNDFKLILNKITKFFDNNTDKIIEYKNNYILDDKCNLLYFKDYRGIEFIIHGIRKYLHEINPIEKNYYYNGFEQYKGNCKLIVISLCLENNVYMYETNDSYKITNNRGYEVKYEFPIMFSNSEINLSFRNIENSKPLLRYDFVNATNKLNNILDTLSDVKYNYLKELPELYKDKVYSPIKFTDENINNEIYKTLYPIIYLVEKYLNETLNIKLNVDFTIQDGKKQPWLIKDFIETLDKFNIYNVYNII